MVHATVWLLVLGLILDFLLSINPLKLFISGGIAWLIIKTGREGLREVAERAPIERQPQPAR